jgi:UDP-N-acetylmuramoyl-tripeptide--D-alanyl-D-alanine ligase
MRPLIKKIITLKITWIARAILWRHKPQIIAITGSVGKTSTKDAIYTVLKARGGVRKSEKSFNSDIGVPLSIIGSKNGWDNPFAWFGIFIDGIRQIFARRGTYPKTLVLEVGADHPGDISKIAKWLKPHIVVITRLPDVPVHIEFFPTLQSIIDEKVSLAKYLRKEGTLILNADDPRVLAVKEKMHMRTVTYGCNPISDIKASNVQFLIPGESEGALTPGGLAFKLEFSGKSLPVIVPNIYAESFLSVVLAALTVAYVLEENMITAIMELNTYETPPGRARLIAGMHDTVLIDDTYNSSPVACEAGLHMLQQIPFGKRKIAIIGDMLELGRHTNDAHRAIGALAKECATVLITVGLRAKECALGAQEAGMSDKKIFIADSALAAAEHMQSIIKTGDVILIKGSQGMRMERAVEALMAEPERASELLVRQESHWK